MKGHEYADLIAAYLTRNYGPRGLSIYREVSLGKSIIGKNRRIDVFAVHEATTRALAIECKYQQTGGTADEKLPYTLSDLAAMHVPAFACYAGGGFSEGVLHMLRASEIAAYCLPGPGLEPSGTTLELDHVVAMTFGWWDAVLRQKKKFSLEGWVAPSAAPPVPTLKTAVAEAVVPEALAPEAVVPEALAPEAAARNDPALEPGSSAAVPATGAQQGEANSAPRPSSSQPGAATATPGERLSATSTRP